MAFVCFESWERLNNRILIDVLNHFTGLVANMITFAEELSSSLYCVEILLLLTMERQRLFCCLKVFLIEQKGNVVKKQIMFTVHTIAKRKSSTYAANISQHAGLQLYQ